MLDDIYDIVSIIRAFVYGDGVRKDNLIFRILTKHTACVFFVCFLVNVFCLSFSNPISCISDKEVANVIDTFCWIKAMYTLPKKPDKDLAIHEGVRQQEPSDQVLVHHFYQFVYVILALQACAFYIPRLIWNGLENGRMKSYKDLLEKISPLTAELDEEESKSLLFNTEDEKNEGSEWEGDTVDSTNPNYKDLLEKIVKTSVDSHMTSYRDLLDQINPLMSELYDEKKEAKKKMVEFNGNKDSNEKKETNKEKLLTSQKVKGKKEKVKTKREQNKAKLANYLYEQLHHYHFYAGRLILCELLAVANIFFNVLIMNSYLGKAYLTYGMDLALKYSFDEDSFSRKYPTVTYFSRTNQITSQIFPKVTKCTMNVSGPGGNLVPFDALCVLSINVANEMIYFVLWWWLVYIMCISAIGILYRLIFIFSANLRVKVLKKYLQKEKIQKMSSHTKLHFDILMKEIKFSDWFVLCLVKKNTDRVTFTELLIEMAEQGVEACGEKKEESLSLLRNEERLWHQDGDATDKVAIRCHRYSEDYVDYSYNDKHKSSRVHYTKPRGTLHQRQSEDLIHECHAMINFPNSTV